MTQKKEHAFRIYGAGPHPIRTIYYRRLIKHGGSLAVTLPAAIKSRWGALRNNAVKITLWDSGLLTIEPMEGLNYESTQDPTHGPRKDPPASSAAPDLD